MIEVVRVRELTPLAVAVLGLLSERDMHPYEMFQTMVARADDKNVKVRPGTLYHQVGRLTTLGYASIVGTDRAGNRPERTTYRITDAGRAVLAEQLRSMVAKPADEYPQFHLALSAIQNLSAEEAAHGLESRAVALEDTRSSYAAILDHTRAIGLPERYSLNISYIDTMLGAQLDWIRTTAARIRAGDIPWSELEPAGVPQTNEPKEDVTR